MLNHVLTFQRIAELHALNRVKLYDALKRFYISNRQIVEVDGSKSYSMKISVRTLASMVRRYLWCADVVRVTTKTIVSDENDLGIGGSYTTSTSPRQLKKPIDLQLVLYDNGDGGYWINSQSIACVVDEIYDTIEHELRHLMQDLKSEGRAFNSPNVAYLSKPHEVDAFATMAISQIKRHMRRTSEDINSAIATSSHIINMYRCESDTATVNKLLKKVYRGVTREQY